VVKPHRALVASLAPAGLLALSLAACGDILGLKDLELYPAEGGTDSGEDASADGTSGDTGAPVGDAAGSDARDASGTTDSGAEGDGPAKNDGLATDSSPVADAPEDTSPPIDAPFDAPVDSSTGPDSSCTTGSQTDPHNCGSCGHDCLLGTCQAGLCQPFTIAASVTAYDMVVSNGTLYWVDQQSPGAVWTCTITNNSCSAKTFASNQSTPQRITLGGTGNGTVFWTDYGSGSMADGAIVSLPLGGGTPSTLASGRWTPQGIAADDTYVVWAESFTDQIVRRPLGSSTTTTLPTGASTSPTAVALAAGTIYWTDAIPTTSGSVDMSPEGSLSQMLVSGGQTSPWALAVDSTYVYWVDYLNPGAVWQYTINGGGQKQQLASGENKPIEIASDGAKVYWIDEGTQNASDGKLVEWNVAAGMSHDRATGLGEPSALAIDANAVYFATLDDGLLHMMVR
jgi:hypothetical protein